MVTQQFSSVIGMLPIGGFKNRFLFLGPTLGQKFEAPLIDNPFNDGFWAKISIFFFQVNEMRDEAKLDGYFLGPRLHHPILLKENPCRTWITNPHFGTGVGDMYS